MIEDEAESINEVIIKREKAKAEGNEAEVESIEKMLEKKGFTVRDGKDITIVEKKKANL